MRVEERAKRSGLFVGPQYYDLVYPVSKEDDVGDDKRIRVPKIGKGYGGNAFTAARTVACLGEAPYVVCPNSDCDLGPGFRRTLAASSMTLLPCTIPGYEIPVSSFITRDGKRKVYTGENNFVCTAFPSVDPREYRLAHFDGHFAHHAVGCAKAFSEARILTSFDGGRVRANTPDILRFTKIAIVSDEFRDQMKMSDTEMLDYLQSCGCMVGGITRGERGLLWYDEAGRRSQMPCLFVPESEIVDTANAGDIFHGAYLFSYLKWPGKCWAEHMDFARAASAHSIRFLGINASLPTLSDVTRIRQRLSPSLLT